MLYINGDACYALGINITRCNIDVGIADLGGNIITYECFPVCSPSNAFKKIKDSINNQILKAGIDKTKIYKAAVATPGPVDVGRGTILNPPNFNEWHDVRVVEEIEKITGFETVFDNVSSATALAEKYFGAARRVENFMVLKVDDGIGSGIVLSDTLFKGPCEFGHTSVKYDGIKCECGNRGCLEKYASVPAILKNTSYKSWQEAVDNDDTGLIDKEAEYLSTVIISANNIFNLDKIVLCGDLSYMPEKLIKCIYSKIAKIILSQGDINLCGGMVKSQSLTAAALAIHDLLT